MTIFYGSLVEQGPTACGNIDARLIVTNPTGEVIFEHDAGTASVGGGCGSRSEASGATLAGGEWTVEFSGSGPLAAYANFVARG